MITTTRCLPSQWTAFPLLAVPILLLLFAAFHPVWGAEPSSAGDPIQEEPSPDELYRRATERFYEARFPSAVTDIERFLEIPDLSIQDRIRGLELRGACHLAQSEPIAARKAVEEILDLDPGYVMDPDKVFPPLLKIFFSVLDERGALAFPPGIRSLAVVPLENTSVTEHETMEPLGLGLAQALITDLVGASEVRVVERERLHYVLEEIGRPAGAIDRETAARAGRLVGAQSFLMGNFTRIGDKLRIDVRLVETETGVVLRTRSVDGKVEKVFDLVHDLSSYVVEDLGAVYSRPPSKADAGLQSLMEYAAGLDNLDRGRFAEAEEHLRAALELTPDYEDARRLLRQLTPMLAAGESR